MPIMRRRPLLRAAAVGGGAYYMGKKRQEGAQREADEQGRISNLEAQGQAPAAPAPAAGGLSPDAMQQLEKLGKLHEDGVLTDEEFAQQKAKLLGG
jgi:Short C-terminal domain